MYLVVLSSIVVCSHISVHIGRWHFRLMCGLQLAIVDIQWSHELIRSKSYHFGMDDVVSSSQFRQMVT